MTDDSVQEGVVRRAVEVVVGLTLRRGSNIGWRLLTILNRDLEAGRKVMERNTKSHFEGDVAHWPFEVGILLARFISQRADVVLNGPVLQRMLRLKRMNLKILPVELLDVLVNRARRMPPVTAGGAVSPLS